MPPDRMYPPGVVAVFFAVQGVVALALVSLILLGAQRCAPPFTAIFDPGLTCPGDVEVAWVSPDPDGRELAEIDGELMLVTVNGFTRVAPGACWELGDWERPGRTYLANRCGGDVVWIGPADRTNAEGWSEEDCL